MTSGGVRTRPEDLNRACLLYEALLFFSQCLQVAGRRKKLLSNVFQGDPGCHSPRFLRMTAVLSRFAQSGNQHEAHRLPGRSRNKRTIPKGWRAAPYRVATTAAAAGVRLLVSAMRPAARSHEIVTAPSAASIRATRRSAVFTR